MEYVGLYTSGKSFSLSAASRYRSRFLAQPYLVVSPLSFHPTLRSPVSPQLPALQLCLFHGCIPELRVLLRPDSLPAFSLTITFCTASSLSRLHTDIFILLPPVAYHSVCGLLRVRCTFLTRLSGRVFPFIPLVPSSAPPRIIASLPFSFLFLFLCSFLPSL